MSVSNEVARVLCAELVAASSARASPRALLFHYNPMCQTEFRLGALADSVAMLPLGLETPDLRRWWDVSCFRCAVFRARYSSQPTETVVPMAGINFLQVPDASDVAAVTVLLVEGASAFSSEAGAGVTVSVSSTGTEP